MTLSRDIIEMYKKHRSMQQSRQLEDMLRDLIADGVHQREIPSESLDNDRVLDDCKLIIHEHQVVWAQYKYAKLPQMAYDTYLRRLESAKANALAQPAVKELEAPAPSLAIGEASTLSNKLLPEGITSDPSAVPLKWIDAAKTIVGHGRPFNYETLAAEAGSTSGRSVRRFFAKFSNKRSWDQFKQWIEDEVDQPTN